MTVEIELESDWVDYKNIKQSKIEYVFTPIMGIILKKKSIDLYYHLVNSALRVTNFIAYHRISLKLATY